MLSKSSCSFAGAGVLGVWVLAGVACRQESGNQKPEPKMAVATIEAKNQSGITGTATFTEVDGGVKVVVEINGATPGKHGLHLHEKGDCAAPDGSSAGGHWNPDGVKHGSPEAAEHHAGDFGNIEVAADGTGRLERTFKGLTVGAGKYSVVHKAVVVHAKEDDFSQPTGNAGARIGCGRVEKK